MIPESIRLRDEKPLFFTDETHPKELGGIGHLRGNFGESGDEFRTEWFPHQCVDLNNEKFKIIFGAVIDKLREPGNLLCSFADMQAYCRTQPQCKIPHSYSEQFGFRILTQDYAIYLRCNPYRGDHPFYVYCYDKEMLMNQLAHDRGLPGYCFSYLPTTQEEIRIDFAQSGYTSYRKQGNSRAANEMNRELGITPAQVEAMKVGSMFSWDVPGADPKNYDVNGKPIRTRQKEDREDR